MKTISLVILSLLNHQVSCNNEFIPTDDSNLFKLDEDQMIISPDQAQKPKADSKYFLDAGEDQFIPVPESESKLPEIQEIET
jgi:hypothetical protein